MARRLKLWLLLATLGLPGTAAALESCRESIDDSLRVAKQEPGGVLEAILSWQPQPGARGYEIVRCDAAAAYPCGLVPHATTDTSRFVDADLPSDLYWYRVLAMIDDRFEENDLRPDAPLLSDGTQVDLIRCPADPDWFRIEPACAGGSLELDLSFDAAEGDLDLRLFDGMGTLLEESATVGDFEMIRHAVGGTEPLFLEVDLPLDAGAFVGSGYELTVSGSGGGAACAPDRYEPNRDAPSARPIPVGLHAGLTACDEMDGLNNDFYAIDVTAGQTIDILVRFTHSLGDIDLNLYDTFQSRIAQSQTSTDDESIVFPNAPDTGRYLVQVFLFQLAPCSGGNDYDLEITLR